jgi:hypothetical protein
MVTLMNGEECHNEWKSLMKKFLETAPSLLLFSATTVFAQATSLIFPKRFRSEYHRSFSGIKELLFRRPKTNMSFLVLRVQMNVRKQHQLMNTTGICKMVY